MGKLIDIVEGVQAKSSEHESGASMIVFEMFRPTGLDKGVVERLVEIAKRKLASDADVVRICLDATQEREKNLLESAGFSTDGFEFRMPKSILMRAVLSAKFKVRLMDFEQDIDAVATLEKTVHAADSTSRVNFETPEALAGMRGYYRKACGGKGAYVLTQNCEIVGVAGFMPDHKHDCAIHISSVSISLGLQGRGLFFPFLGACLAHDYFDGFDKVTGITTTERLIAAAEKHGALLLGWSLYKRLERHRA